jgi:hypothetical protein
MNRKPIRTLVVCLGLSLATAIPAYSIFGIGDIVFDPTNFEQALREYFQLQQQYDQLVRTYRTVLDQYTHMRRMAQTVPVDMKTRYRALSTPWRQSRATDTFGNTGGWLKGANLAQDVQRGYAAAVERLEAYGAAWSSLSPDQQERLKADYSTIELTDGANLNTMETLGLIRANSDAVEHVIQGLEDDSLSSAPEMNTEIAVLNKINAATIIALRNDQAANQTLVALAESQLVAAKRIRDAEARAVNQHIQFRSKGKRILDAQSANASAAMSAWRMP